MQIKFHGPEVIQRTGTCSGITTPYVGTCSGITVPAAGTCSGITAPATGTCSGITAMPGDSTPMRLKAPLIAF